MIFALQEMGILEVKHGLLQLAESLDFLHNNARLIHRAISPEVTTSFFVLTTFEICRSEICKNLNSFVDILSLFIWRLEYLAD